MVQTERTLLAALTVLAIVVVAHILEQAQFGRTNVVMVYMLAVVAVAAMLGLWPAVAVSLLGLPLFDRFDIPPHFSLGQSDLAHTFPLVVMLATAVTVSSLAGRLRQQATESERRANRTDALYALAAELAADLDADDVIRVTTRHVARAFNRSIDVEQVLSGGLASILHWLPNGKRDEHLQAMLRLAEQALARAALRERLRTSELRAQQESLRSSILGAVSHDLRTPLASIIGASSSLIGEGEGFAPAARHRLGEVIYGEALQMQRMVENLLDYARLRSGGVTAHNEWQAIEEIVGSTLAAVRRHAGNRRILVDVPDNLPLVRCDGVLIERVLTNLVENALKFSPAGSPVTLVARVEADMLVLRVSDEGPGIEPSLREKVFEPFARFGNQEGSGLGLAICRGIVAAHGGTILVEAAACGGAVLVLRLPLSGEVPEIPSTADEMRRNA